MTDHPGCLEIEATEYLPFGLTRKQTSTEVTYYKFTDQEHDPKVGLYNYNARLYDPAVGTFISPDSIVPDWYDPQLLNRYAYVRNNPLKYVDPTGYYVQEVGRGNHMTSEDLSRDIVDRVESGRGLDADRGQSALADINEVESLKALYSQSLGEISNYSELGFLGKVAVWYRESTTYSEISYRAGLRIAEIPIGGFTKHGLHQVIGRNYGRGVNLKAYLEAIKNPKKLTEFLNGVKKYIGKRATVLLNRDNKVITAYGKSRGSQVWKEGTRRLSGSGPAQRKANKLGYSYWPGAIR